MHVAFLLFGESASVLMLYLKDPVGGGRESHSLPGAAASCSVLEYCSRTEIAVQKRHGDSCAWAQAPRVHIWLYIAQ